MTKVNIKFTKSENPTQRPRKNSDIERKLLTSLQGLRSDYIKEVSALDKEYISRYKGVRSVYSHKIDDIFKLYSI
jgi:hypothetical protein